MIPTKWQLLVDWAVLALKRKTNVNILRFLTKIALQACVYSIWMERNSQIHNHSHRAADEVIQMVPQDPRHRIYSLPKIQASFPSF